MLNFFKFLVIADRENLKYENLFVLENYEFKYTRIKTGTDLKGFSGTWNLTILVNMI